MVVSHNVVTLTRPAGMSRAAQSTRAKTVASKKEIAYDPPVQSASSGDGANGASSNVPPWRRAQSPASPHYAGVTSPTLGSAHAESLTIAPVYSARDPEPQGGETAINPRPAAIAYQEGAEGTTAFEVMIDENGNPTKCIISKSSNWPVLDDAVCNAAMKVKYKPKMISGHPVPGIYRDAFTFRPQVPQNN
jgi:TonB family protein